MASHQPGPCCAQGFKHEGKPTGQIQDIDGTQVYFALPKGDVKPDQAILYITDIMGIYNNSQLLADAFAANGYLTIIPDLFAGKPWKLNAGFEGLMDWIKGYSTDVVDPIIASAIKYLREKKGIKKIAAVGYCFGGKYVCRFLKEGQIDVGYTAHPSFVDPEELAGIETDTIFPSEKRHESEEILQKTGLPYQINLFSGVEHGFAVRGDLDSRPVTFAREQAFTQAATWIKWHL
ncbi:hypothetical protein LOZ53_006612 [Ophidiomyces ophidiicola]|nr:hypothetical protein LOZ64_006645 [Ophidiomyces ophidiicola]KAI1939734.1 hypothetical protein LOZ62_005035 [Ophidiomyces ophidiicola]KAI1946952.1 hypothetical protein LOZ59_006726 [Ophidiomyces ophidiicola]KAI1962740.1 hypothetical protein LOZ56_006536 [Ophidiomyces ophidiicola]KAI1975165.1 hypothetical protein LOZ55_004791 [Ophidiomyces ophidiicola]